MAAFECKYSYRVPGLQKAPAEVTGKVFEDLANSEEVQALHEAEKRLYAVLNEMFGGNMAEAFFGKMHPFSPVNGNFYCENAIEAVGAFISKQFEVETDKMNKKVAKYTKGYKPGKTK